MQGPDLIRCILLPGSRVKPGPPWEVGWAVALGWSCRMRLHPCRMRCAFHRMLGTWGSSGMNLDQRGKCMCGGRVPVLGGLCPRPGRTVSPSWEDQTPPPSWPLLPTLWSSPPAGVWGRKGMSHPEGGSTPANPPGQVRSQGFLQEERKLEQEEEPPGGWGAARPSGAAGVSSWAAGMSSQAAGASSGAAGGLAGQQGRPAGPLPPGPELRPCAGLTCVSVRLRRLQ